MLRFSLPLFLQHLAHYTVVIATLWVGNRVNKTTCLVVLLQKFQIWRKSLTPVRSISHVITTIPAPLLTSNLGF